MTLKVKNRVCIWYGKNEEYKNDVGGGGDFAIRKKVARYIGKIDDSQDEGKAYPFPYAKGYSAEGHTGWYAMPGKGDIVQIVFLTEDENQAYAVQSVRQEDTDKTADSEVKYLRTQMAKKSSLTRKKSLLQLMMT